jgi:hypothetical protein
MSKDSQVTNTIAEIIQYDFVSGPAMKPLIRTQYELNGTFVDIDQDIISRSISQKNDNDQYQVYSLMPPVSQMDIQLNNYSQKYSPGNTASAFENVFTKNQLIRCWSGYELTFDIGTGTISDDFSTRTKFVHTKEHGGEVVPDVSSFDGTIGAYASLGVQYDATTYDATTYAYPGYYKKKFRLPLISPTPTHLKVTTTSNNFDLKYRVSEKQNMFASVWNGYRPLSTGANTFELTADFQDEWVEVLIRFDNNFWDTADRITDIDCGYSYRGQLFRVGTFVLDEPIYGGANLQLKGRDYLKKALETEVKLPAIENQPVNNVVAKVLDRCSIPYDTANWYNPATTVSLSASGADSLDEATGWQVLDKLMDAVNAGDNDIRFSFDATGRGQIKRVLTDVEADWVAHYFYNVEKSSMRNESDKQIQRITVLQKQFVTSPELTIATFTGSTTGSASFIYPSAAYYTGGNWTSSTNATGVTSNNDFLYVRYIDNNSSGTFGKIDTELDRSNNSIRLSFTGATGGSYPYNFTVLGGAPKKSSGYVYAERGNAKNILNNEGSTYKRVNEFLNATTAKAFADYYIGYAGDPKKVVNVDMVANPLLELNDNLMNISQWLFDDTIYGLSEINESWNEPSLRHSLKLRDRGFNLDNFIWDRPILSDFHQQLTELDALNFLKWDIGLIWDQDYSPNSTGDGAVSYEDDKAIAFN